MTYWFRPPIRCLDIYDSWLEMWAWIATAHSERWYPTGSP